MSKRQRRSVRHRRERIIAKYRDAVTSEPEHLDAFAKRANDTVDADLPELERALDEHIASRQQQPPPIPETAPGE